MVLSWLTLDEQEGPLQAAKKVVAPLPPLLGLAACWLRVRPASRWWWAPALLFLASAWILLDVLADYEPPEGEEGCSSEGFLPPGVGTLGQAVAVFAAPWLALAGVAAAIALLVRGHRLTGAWCLLGVVALGSSWWASMALCAP